MSSGAELRAAGIIVPANPKNPVARAEHIEMPDGSRLSEFNTAYPVKAGQSGDVLDPETFYQFGEVGGLEVTLGGNQDGMAHEYILTFTPLEGFVKPVITPEPVWLGDPQFPAGKLCVVSVLGGLAVSGCG